MTNETKLTETPKELAEKIYHDVMNHAADYFLRGNDAANAMALALRDAYIDPIAFRAYQISRRVK